MLKIRKRNLKRMGKSVLSFVLIMAMMLGLIPQSAYAAAQTEPKAASKSYESEGCTITYK